MARLAHGSDAAVVLVHGLLGDEQAQASAARALGGEEYREQAREGVRLHADAVVLDLEEHSAGVGAGAE